MKSFDDFTHYFKLTPNGLSYQQGTWTETANAPVGVLYGPTGVLIDGRALFGGGEYLQGTNDSNTIEVYDPVSNRWTQAPDGLFGDIGDVGAEVMSDGKYLVGYRFGPQTEIYDPIANNWTQTGSSIAAQGWASGDEEGWQLLPDGSILSTFVIGQRFIPSLGQWVATAPLNTQLVDSEAEIGATLLMYNGKVLVTGGLVGGGQSAIYTPPSTLMGTDDSWVTGPVIPGNQGSPDCAACVETNGKVLFISADTEYDSGPTFNEYDPSTGNVQQIQGPPSNNGGASYGSYMLALPNGQVLVTGFANETWLYTPTSGPQSSWRATLNSLSLGNDGTTYTLSGSQLNGFSNGAAYNDEGEMYTNYPVVYLHNTNTNTDYWARASNPTNLLPTSVGAVTQTHFVLPSTVPPGRYQVWTSASGVRSSNSLELGFGLSMPPQTTVNATPGGTVSYSMPSTDYYIPTRSVTAHVSKGPTWVTWDGANLIASPPVGTRTGVYPVILTAYDNGTPSASGETGIMIKVASVSLLSARFQSSIVNGGGTAYLNVTLSQPAPAGGTLVHLTTTSRYLTPPATATVPEGSTTLSIPIPAGSPLTVTNATVSASIGALAIPALVRISPTH